MKTLLSYLFLPATIFAFILLQDGFDAYEKKQVSEFTKAKYASKAQNFFGYWDWLNKIRSNPATGKIDYKAFQNAREQALTHKLSAKRSLTMDWKDLGPSNHGGRTRAFLIDRNDYNKLFAGGVAGGLWTSDDAGYNWKQVTGFEGYATVASICQTTNGDIYVGTGEGLYVNFGFAAGGLPGNGIYKSTDGGVTFSHLTITSATLNSASDIWSHVNRLVADPNDPLKLYAATEKGIRVSTDGGSSWSLINMDVSALNPSMDIEISSDGNTIIGAVSQYCYLSTDGGDNFTRINGDGGFPSSGSIGRIELAIAPSDKNYIYAGIANGGGDLVGIYQSKDGGANWTLIGPGGSQSFKPYSSSAQSQGTYDNSLGVDLDDPEKLFVGGVGLYSWNPADGWNKIATTSDGDPAYYVHSDMHFIQVHPTNANTIYFLNDGGIFVSYDGGETFAQMSHGYRTMQMYSVAVSDSGNVIGGLQDNGTQYIDYAGQTNSSSVELSGGDGGYVAISWTKTNAYFAASQNGVLFRSSNNGNSFSTIWNKRLDDDDDGKPDAGASFVTPFKFWESTSPKQDTTIEAILPSNPNENTNNVVYDTIVQTIDNPNMYFACLNNGVWVSKECLNFTVSPEWYKVISSSGEIHAIDVSQDGDAVFVSVGSGGNLYRATGLKDAIYGYRFNPNIILDGVTNGNSVYSLSSTFDRTAVGIKDTLIAASFGRTITAIAVDKNDANHVVVGLGNQYYSQSGTSYIYESTDALSNSPTFTAINGSGILSPVYSLVIDVDDPSIIYAGTEFGVYATENGNGNGASTSWDYVGPEKVPVFAMEQVDLSGNISNINGTSLFIGTHGRGFFAHNFDPCADRGFCTTSIEDQVNKGVSSSNINVYPNPMTKKGFAQLELKKESDVRIDLFDISGKRIKTLINENMPRGVLKLDINVQGLKGVYFLKSMIDDKEYSNKMIVL